MSIFIKLSAAKIISLQRVPHFPFFYVKGKGPQGELSRGPDTTVGDVEIWLKQFNNYKKNQMAGNT